MGMLDDADFLGKAARKKSEEVRSLEDESIKKVEKFTERR